MNNEAHAFIKALCPNLSPTHLALAAQRFGVFLDFTRKIKSERQGLPAPKRLDIPFSPYQIQGEK